MRIAIIGAGIGGLTAAAGLQRDGHEVTVFERRAAPAGIGAGLTLFGNAFTALDAIGLGGAVRAVSGDALGRVRSGQRQPSGRWLVAIEPGDAPPVRSMHRAELHRVLLELLSAGAVRAGVDAQPEPGGAPVVRTDRGMEHFDLVVAADGVHSRSRALWGLDRGVRYCGYTAWRGVTASRGHLGDEAGETWGAGARFGIVPLPDERVYWFAVLTAPPRMHFGNEQALLRRRFGPWHAPIAELLDATPGEAILRRDIVELAMVPHRFVAGRGVLLGDAAHAMAPDLGQGAGLAIEDAAALVLLLRAAAGPGREQSVDAALRRYSRLRRRRAAMLWRGSRAMGRLAQLRGPTSVALRDAVLRAVPAPLVGRGAGLVQRGALP